MNTNSEPIKDVLRENVRVLVKAAARLERSREACEKVEAPFSEGDLDLIEMFTSRFARASDLLTNRASKSLFAAMGEDAGVFLDVVHLLEKIGIVEDARMFMEIRTLRNKIAHEYTEEGLARIAKDCQMLSPPLLTTIERFDAYARRVLDASHA